MVKIALIRSQLTLLLFGLSFNSVALVSVTVGPTYIPSGNAIHAKDITVRNNHLAIGIAVESAPPWGVARGGIIDVAVVRQGEVGQDRASLVDFIPNNWSSWPTTYQQITIEKNTPEEVIVKTVRDWEAVTLTTIYSLKAGESRVHIVTEMKNAGDKSYKGLLSGYVFWPDGGYLFGVPGMYGVGAGSMTRAIAKWNAAYDEDWNIGLHAPYAQVVNYSARDLYLKHDLGTGQELKFEGWLEVSDRGDLSAMVAGEIQLLGLTSGQIGGTVSTDKGVLVENPVIVVLKNGQPYTWVIGHSGRYQLALPIGEYQVYATAKQYSQSPKLTIKVTEGSIEALDFNSLLPPGKIEFNVSELVSHNPLDARITIEKGDVPLIEYLGQKTFFTHLNNRGQSTVKIAPGEYQFSINSAAGFKAKAIILDINVQSGRTFKADAKINVQVQPENSQWYSADLHHHSDVLDGSTPPEYVLRSQLAVGLDLAFISDHDSSKNHQIMAELAKKRGIPFIPSMEISPSWGHFNAYPLTLSQDLSIDSGTATIDEVFKAAQKLGASALQVNHPLIPFGYLSSIEKGTANGKFNPNFNVLEINAHTDYMKTIKRARQYWNEGKKYYLSAGSDTHNVWNENSGQVRSYVHVNGKLTAENYVDNLRQGHSYVTFGPIIFPQKMFGSQISSKLSSDVSLDFDIQAVNGLKAVKLIEGGNIVQEKSFPNIDTLTKVSFNISTIKDTWYSLVVEDAKNKQAFSNPIWIKVAK